MKEKLVSVILLLNLKSRKKIFILTMVSFMSRVGHGKATVLNAKLDSEQIS